MQSLFFSKVKSSQNLSIDTERIHSDFKGMVHDISCQICLNIVYPTPVSCGNCHRMFCKSCIDDWKCKKNRCPNDHEYVETPVNQLARNLLAFIKISCSNAEAGCTRQICYGDYLRHVDSECDFLEYQCHGCNLKGNKKIVSMHVNVCDSLDEKCVYCNQVFKRKILSDHLKSCDERMIECDLCEKSFKNYQFIQHQNFCDERVISCEYCKMKYKKKYENLHTKDVCFKELINNIPANSQNSSKDKLLREKDAQIAKLEAEKNALQKQVDLLTSDKNKLNTDYSNLSKNNETIIKDNNNLTQDLEQFKKAYEQWKAYAEKVESDLNRLKTNQNGANGKNVFGRAKI